MGTVYPSVQEKRPSCGSSKLPARTLSSAASKLVKSASGDNMGDALLVSAQAQDYLAQIRVRDGDMEDAFRSGQSSRAESLSDEQQRDHAVDAADEDSLFSKVPGAWSMPLADGPRSRLISQVMADAPDAQQQKRYMKELKRDIKKLEPALTAYFSTLPENKKLFAENLVTHHLLSLLKAKHGDSLSLAQDIRSIRQSRNTCCIIQ